MRLRVLRLLHTSCLTCLKSFPQQTEGKWNQKLHEIVVSYKQDLSKDPVLLDKVRQYTSSTLGLNYTSPFKAANDETAAALLQKQTKFDDV